MSSKSSHHHQSRSSRDADETPREESSTRKKKRATTFVLFFEKRDHLSLLLVFKAPRFIASFIHIDFSQIVSNSLSLIKKGDLEEKRRQKTLRERIERRKLSSSLFRTVTTCPSLSCMSLTGTPTPFPLRPTLLLMTTDDNSFLIKRRSTLSKKEVLYGLGFVSLGCVSS